jgi:hypothetical protein
MRVVTDGPDACLTHEGRAEHMSEAEAFIVVLLLLGIATVLSRKYLSSNAQLALGVIATTAHLV